MPVPLTSALPAFEVRIEPSRNLLRIVYRGHVTAQAAKAMADQAVELVPGLRLDFTVLTDLTGLEAMDLGCVPHMTRLMEFCKTCGIGTTMRVIPNPRKDIGLTILANIHYGSSVSIITHRSLAEAEAALAQ